MIISFILGMMVGAAIGIVMSALAHASKTADEADGVGLAKLRTAELCGWEYDGECRNSEARQELADFINRTICCNCKYYESEDE